jgi:hypothetical protein
MRSGRRHPFYISRFTSRGATTAPLRGNNVDNLSYPCTKFPGERERNEGSTRMSSSETEMRLKPMFSHGGDDAPGLSANRIITARRGAGTASARYLIWGVLQPRPLYLSIPRLSCQRSPRSAIAHRLMDTPDSRTRKKIALNSAAVLSTSCVFIFCHAGQALKAEPVPELPRISSPSSWSPILSWSFPFGPRANGFCPKGLPSYGF